MMIFEKNLEIFEYIKMMKIFVFENAHFWRSIFRIQKIVYYKNKS